MSTVAGQASHRRKHHGKCNAFADGNASVASFNYVHGTAFLPPPPAGQPDPGRGEHGSKDIYVCDEARLRPPPAAAPILCK